MDDTAFPRSSPQAPDAKLGPARAERRALIAAVIFDMDGVLIDSEPLHYHSDSLVARELGLDLPREYFDQFIGTSAEEMWRSIFAEFGIDSDMSSVLARQTAAKIRAVQIGDYSPIAGIPRLLRELRSRRIPLAVASSSPSAFIEAVVRKLDIRDYFSALVSGESMSRGKPQPDIFLEAARALAVVPERCLVIEDSSKGVLAAKRAAMTCIGYENPNSGNQDLSLADMRIGDFNKLDISAIIGESHVRNSRV